MPLHRGQPAKPMPLREQELASLEVCGYVWEVEEYSIQSQYCALPVIPPVPRNTRNRGMIASPWLRHPP